MSAEQLATRILSENTEISSEKIRRGELSSNDFQKLVKSSQELESALLFIDDTPAIPYQPSHPRSKIITTARLISNYSRLFTTYASLTGPKDR